MRVPTPSVFATHGLEVSTDNICEQWHEFLIFNRAPWHLLVLDDSLALCFDSNIIVNTGIEINKNIMIIKIRGSLILSSQDPTGALYVNVKP